jgi:AcrR family transcriptional regulator
VYDEHGRRVAAPSKGERRERTILDEAERQLREVGADAMTVESIANAAGITRAALYFYFRSKNDVLAALVRRAAVEMTSGVATSDQLDASPAKAIAEAIRRTSLLWKAHGAVLRAAVDLAPGVPVIGELWDDARGQIERSAVDIVRRGAGDDSAETENVPALVRALVGMTEREFYVASSRGEDIDQVVETLQLVWNRSLRLR